MATHDEHARSDRRTTSSYLKKCVREAISQPHIDLNVAISRVYGGFDPPQLMLADILRYKPFVDDGLADKKNGLKLSDVESCDSLLSFEKKIESWYSNRGWTVVV
jgi:hypothetical protein